MLDPDRERRTEALFHEAVGLPAAERAAFLDRVCDGDAPMRSELEALLSIDARDTDDLTPPLADPSQPQHLGPYEILREIGHGGMGTVYLALQREPVRREVALKLLRSRIENSELEARFAAERQACALMQHPGIAKIFDAGSAPGDRPYYVMEYVRGVPIVEHCTKYGLGTSDRIRLFVSVCRAVHHAHQKGVIHRDLKPSNILVDMTETATEDAARAQPKIIDFGVAKSTEAQLSPTTLATLDGQLIGTPEYMSPEQATGHSAQLDTRSDVYSLGVILYELLAGKRPFAGLANRLDVLRAIQEDDPKAPGTLSAHVDRELDWITLRALEKDPKRRYQSASELAADLERYLRNEVVDAGPPSSIYRFRKLVRRNRGLVAGVSIGLAALVVGLFVALWQSGIASDNADRAQKHLLDYRRMVDVRRVQDLIHDADGPLWPVRPAKIERMQKWLDDARDLIERRTQHRARIVDLDKKLSEGGLSDIDTTEMEWQRDTLEELVGTIGRLEQTDRRGATIASMTWRLEHARNMVSKTVDDHEAIWQRAIRSIADRSESPRYDGLRIRPQVGLVPLGRNHHTGLWEFWHPASGRRPMWHDDAPDVAVRSRSTCELERDSGLVFILIPGGTFRMGAERPPSGRGYGANIDPHSGHVSRPVHEVTLDPFFLSRFEMTQGQWFAWTKARPSRLQPPESVRGHRTTWTHPVERVTYTAALQVLRELGLSLPTEAQWEYAYRSGTSTVFERGNRLSHVRNHENLADEASRPIIRGNWDFDAGTDDGYGLHAPVGSFAPTRWGLHDMPGNVAEWCLDKWGSYDLPVRKGDGLRLVPDAESTGHIVRGGSFYWRAINARCADRHQYSAKLESGFIGLRPARNLAPK